MTTRRPLSSSYNTEKTTPTGNDIMYLVSYPYGAGNDGYIKVSNLYKALGLGWVDVRSYGADLTGSEDCYAEVTEALDSLTTGNTLYFPFGTYSYATSPNFSKSYVGIYAEPGTIFNHTGSGNAFIVDGGASGAGVLGMRFDNITVQGNANSTNGFYARSVHHSIFNHINCKGAATTGSGILIQWCVANQWNSPRISTNETLNPVPLHGIYIDRRGSGSDNATTQTIINPVIEGVTGKGIYIDYASNNTIIGGTSESNDYGIYITTNGYGNNNIDGVDFEANTTYDAYIDGPYNTLKGIYATGEVNLNEGYNTLIGGTIATLTIGATSYYNTISGLLIVTTYTDSSTNTKWYGVQGPGGVPIGDKPAKTRNELIALADDGTPSVLLGNIFYTQGTTAITDFDDGVTGQVITVLAEHTLTITDGTNIFLNGSTNFDMTATDTLTLICKSDNKWYEISRGDNGA